MELQNEALDWITVIRKEIESAIVSSKEPFAGPQASKSRSSAIDPQKIQPDARTLDILYYYSPACAECGAKQPVWASLNLCVLLCPECSGVHRSLGSHISKVRGLTLDNWSINSLLLLEKIGSLKANEFWEYNMFEMVSGCLTPSSSREERYDMINLKVNLIYHPVYMNADLLFVFKFVYFSIYLFSMCNENLFGQFPSKMLIRAFMRL